MIFGYFTLFVALTISAVAEYYSIVGLTAIFSAAFWPIVIMGASLGIGKVTAAVWLKLNWDRASWTYKLYLVPAVAFLMVLTSMGIFGFLSKAHSDQSLVSGDSMAKVAIYDEKIKTAKDNIDANRKALKQMDEAVDQVMGRSNDEKGADKAVAIRRSQGKERARLLAEIEVEQRKVSALAEERVPFAAEFRKVESEVGPIKYIAALVYGDNPDSNILEKAVRLVIILIVAVFDPLALVLILAAQQSIKWAKEPQVKQEVEPVVENVVVAPAAVDDAEPTAQSVPTEPQPTVDPFAYLKTPFVHFKDLEPMVHKPEQPVLEIYSGNPDDFKEPWTDQEKADLVKAMEGFFEQNKKAAEEAEQVEEEFLERFDQNLARNTPEILTMGIDDIERPGDYITPPAAERVPEASPGPNRGMMYTQPVQADNVTMPEKSSNTSFGNEYPTSPEKGDMYLRTDFLPNRLFKFNGVKWIEVDKSLTDVYAYEEQYIKHLIDEIEAGRYDLESLTDIEKEQIQHYLNKNAL